MTNCAHRPEVGRRIRHCYYQGHAGVLRGVDTCEELLAGSHVDTNLPQHIRSNRDSNRSCFVRVQRRDIQHVTRLQLDMDHLRKCSYNNYCNCMKQNDNCITARCGLTSYVRRNIVPPLELCLGVVCRFFTLISRYLLRTQTLSTRYGTFVFKVLANNFQ